MSQTLSFQLEAADPKTFLGDAFIRLFASASEREFVKLYYVRFEPAARTNWHSHSGDQILIGTGGVCTFQLAGGPVEQLPEGQSVRIPAGMRHWHGAAPDQPGEHAAINLEIRETIWSDPVTEEAYRQDG